MVVISLVEVEIYNRGRLEDKKVDRYDYLITKCDNSIS